MHFSTEFISGYTVTGGEDMKKWTWQWLVLLGFFGVLFSCGKWIETHSYHIYEDVYRPSNPWKQMIWEARVAGPSSYRALRHFPSASLGQEATLSLGIESEDRRQTTEIRFQIGDCRLTSA